MSTVVKLVRDHPMLAVSVGELVLGMITVLLIPNTMAAIVAMLVVQTSWGIFCGYLNDGRLVAV